MKMYIILLMISVNGFLSIQSIPGTPIYASNNCIYPNDTAPSIDFVESTFPAGGDISNSSDLLKATSYPTNSTFDGSQWSGLGNIFDPFTNLYESTVKQINLVVISLGSQYPFNVWNNLSFTCYMAADNGQLVESGTSQIWTRFLAVAGLVTIFLTALMVFYVFTGKSFGLTQ